MDQAVSMWLGGHQTFDFVSPHFEIKADLWVYPMWVDMLYNELTFHTETIEFCNDTWWIATLGQFYLEVTLGFDTCFVGVYDRYLADEEEKLNYSCNMTYWTLDDLINS